LTETYVLNPPFLNYCEGKMLMAFDDGGFTIKDVPTDDPTIPLFPIESHAQAGVILEWAGKQQIPDVQWAIVGEGPYGVHGKTI
jgi:hypothetical protein